MFNVLLSSASMKHYYFYILAGREIDETANFYKVAVGQSKQAQRDFLFLTSFSVEHGDYFEICNTQSIEFVDRIRESLHVDMLDMIYCDARDLVRAIKSDTSLAERQGTHMNADQMRRYLNVNYRIISNIRGRSHSNC